MGADWSSPIVITQAVNVERKNADGIALHVTTDKAKVYQNAELILNIEIKTALPLQSGTLNKPEIKDAIVEPLVEEGQSESIENGIRFIVVKRSYAVFPSKPGRLIIPSVVFRGIARQDRGLGGSWPGFFGGGQQVFARSPEIVIEVLDMPASYPKDQAFLPLKGTPVIESSKAR